MLHKSDTIDVIVLGAGIAGCLSALKIADAGMRVLLIEKKEEPLLGASNITPGRMGLGFHYQHPETALAYLHSTINFVKQFPGFCVGKDTPQCYLQRGRYFIVKDSLFSKESILSTYQQIAQEYARLIHRDDSNKVFGEPEHFWRILKPEEYQNDVNLDLVSLGVETAECLLDWPLFRLEVLRRLQSHENILTQTNTKVDTANYDAAEGKYVIKTRFTKNPKTKAVTEYKAEFIVNATWEYVEEITLKAGLRSELAKGGYTHRLKVLAEVELPETLRSRNSMFFCMGPHCMFSNLGNGKGLISYAPKTNILSSTKVKVSPKIELFTKENRTKMEEKALYEVINKRQFGKEIIEGVSKYIPQMKKASLIGLRFGLVKTQGKVDIFDHRSQFHMRNYSGVEDIALGWINNSAMKLLYGYNNANLVMNIITEHLKIKRGSSMFLRTISPQWIPKLDPLQPWGISSLS